MGQATKAAAVPRQYVIDMSKPWHVAWWASQFCISEEMLRDAVAQVGNRAEMVQLYLEYLEYQAEAHA